PKRQQAVIEALLEAAPGAIIGVDPRGRIVLINAQAEELLGYPRAKLLGKGVEVLVPEHAGAVHPAHRARYMAGPTSRPMGAGEQPSVRRMDGSEFPAEISLNAVDTGTGMLVVAAIRDVPERLRADAKVRGL